MTNDQTTATTEAPPRPPATDDGVWNAAVAALWDEVKEWYCGNETSEHMGNLIAICMDAPTSDGYVVARILEDDYDWSPDAALVAILDGWPHHLSVAHRNAIREWVTANNILLGRSLGDRVNVKFAAGTSDGRKRLFGEIRSLHHDTAEYSVLLDEPIVENGSKLYLADCEDVTGDDWASQLQRMFSTEDLEVTIDRIVEWAERNAELLNQTKCPAPGGHGGRWTANAVIGNALIDEDCFDTMLDDLRQRESTADSSTNATP